MNGKLYRYTNLKTLSGYISPHPPPGLASVLDHERADMQAYGARKLRRELGMDIGKYVPHTTGCCRLILNLVVILGTNFSTPGKPTAALFPTANAAKCRRWLLQ